MYDFDLGPYSLPVTTSVPEAQLWFDRGLNWTFGYNHEEAVACFQKATKADPECAMTHWGIAYAAGPNYNMPWHLFDRAGRATALATAYDATQKALAASVNATPSERALIAALPARYPQRDTLKDMMPWNHAFADAMAKVHAEFPDNLDLRTIYAEALLNLTPWKMWDLASGTPAEGARTAECQHVLEQALADNPAAWDHPGLLHLYVHLMEMSPTPEAALRAGDRLRIMVPDAGHLVHMPTHIDVLCGHYRDVVHWNQQATKVDAKFVAHAGADNLYTGYRIHNLHFTIYGAMFLGQFDPAMEAVQGIRDAVPEEVLRIPSPPMADFMEGYLAFEPHVLVRFGRWAEAIAMQLPEDQELYCTLTANIHYARGIAHAALGNVPAARIEQDLFTNAVTRIPERRRIHNNRVIDLMGIAAEMLEGEIAYREGNYDHAFAALRRAVHAEDTLPYDEPWGWMQPVRHALGALLFEQSHAAEAEQVFREDLGLGGHLSRATVHPDNVWALKGLYDCLTARGDTTERPLIKQRLDLANARADHAADAPCFCAGGPLADSDTCCS